MRRWRGRIGIAMEGRALGFFQRFQPAEEEGLQVLADPREHGFRLARQIDALSDGFGVGLPAR